MPLCPHLTLTLITQYTLISNYYVNCDFRFREVLQLTRIQKCDQSNQTYISKSQCRTAVIHCCKGDAASQWEMAILGVSELRNPWRCYGDTPSYLADLITPSAAATVRPGLRSAASSTVAVPQTTSSLGDRSFAVAGPRAWNKLPPPLRRVYSAATFKRQLKTFLYNHAFNWHC